MQYKFNLQSFKNNKVEEKENEKKKQNKKCGHYKGMPSMPVLFSVRKLLNNK